MGVLSFEQELRRLALAKRIVSVAPAKGRVRLAKMLYDFQSSKYKGVDIVVPLISDDLHCLVNTKDIIGWNIFFFGEYEAATNRALEKYLCPGDVVVEAGSNIGSETVLISKLVGEQGRVHCFEPNPYAYDKLDANVKLNSRFGNTVLYKLALGEQNKEITFYIYPPEFWNSGLASKYHETETAINATQVTLDSWVKDMGLSRLDFLKMDIQGGEKDVLDGAEETLRRFRPKIFTEADNDSDLGSLYATLKRSRYSIYHIEGKLHALRAEKDLVHGNWLALPEEAAS